MVLSVVASAFGTKNGKRLIIEDRKMRLRRCALVEKWKKYIKLLEKNRVTMYNSIILL
jgi:hypothetical protein